MRRCVTEGNTPGLWKHPSTAGGCVGQDPGSWEWSAPGDPNPTCCVLDPMQQPGSLRTIKRVPSEAEGARVALPITRLDGEGMKTEALFLLV